MENAAESESEDEWNYIKGDDANKENLSPQPEKEVREKFHEIFHSPEKLIYNSKFLRLETYNFNFFVSSAGC